MTRALLAGGPRAGLKSVFHKVETHGHARVEIPVFTGMTVFGAVLRIGGMVGVVIRHTLLLRFSDEIFETRPYRGC